MNNCVTTNDILSSVVLVTLTITICMSSIGWKQKILVFQLCYYLWFIIDDEMQI